MDVQECDLLIFGASTGGTAAAMAAAECGLNTWLVEPSTWIGGQLTAQGVSTPDENAFIETFPPSRRYAWFRASVRDYYRSLYKLSPIGKAMDPFNPGRCWVSRLSFEPKVGQRILYERLHSLEENGNLHILLNARCLRCDMNTDGRMLERVIFSVEGRILAFRPRYVLDATDTGDLLPLCGKEGVDWVVGAESREQTGEPDAPPSPRPDWVQPFTFPFAIEWSPETREQNCIAPPPDYEELKQLQNYSLVDGAITGLFSGNYPWWSYRRILAAENFDDPRIPHDVSMINTASNDFYGGNIIGANAGDENRIRHTLARARRASVGYLYWLQNECPREDDPNQHGYPEFRLRKDYFDTEDGCAPSPYIRESRRILSVDTVREQDIVVRDFQGHICRGEQARAVFMPDTIGIGHYALDIHKNAHGEPSAYVPTRPFQIPLRILIPRRWENLLPAGKNAGLTHLTNGAYRLHPIEWCIGEAAGILVAYCIATNAKPREIYSVPSALSKFQAKLLEEGLVLHWYTDVPPHHPSFYALQRLACRGIGLGKETDLLFRPKEPMQPEDWGSWRALLGLPAQEMPRTVHRAEAVHWLAQELNEA
jgi:hypothetical protein